MSVINVALLVRKSGTGWRMRYRSQHLNGQCSSRLHDTVSERYVSSRCLAFASVLRLQIPTSTGSSCECATSLAQIIRHYVDSSISYVHTYSYIGTYAYIHTSMYTHRPSSQSVPSTHFPYTHYPSLPMLEDECTYAYLGAIFTCLTIFVR